MNTLLITDDEKAVRYSFQRMFEDEYKVLTAEDGITALKIIDEDSSNIDVVFLDVKMSGMNGLEVLRKIKKKRRNMPVVIMTAFSDSHTAIEAMKEGAFDYLIKPLDGGQLKDLIEKAVSSAKLQHAAFCCKTKEMPVGADAILGRSKSILEVCKMTGQAAGTNVPVLVTGESGVGKELVARAIYNHSKRKDHPFMAVNCAALPEGIIESELFGSEKGAFTGADKRRIGRFEQCDGGTIFLDEIGDMNIFTQAKLLRVLQDGTFERLGSNETLKSDVRIIAASNKDLGKEVNKGKFRKDLYHRLYVLSIHIAPLRKRKEDIQELTEYFIARAAREIDKDIKGISPEAIKVLELYKWPGNIRELQNVLKRAVVFCAGEMIGIEDIDLDSTPYKKELCALSDVIDNIFESALALDNNTDIYNSVISNTEKTLIEKALSVTKGNQVKASAMLGITRVTLRKKMQAYHIHSV